MDSAYVGESFIQRFIFGDERDDARTPDTVEYRVLGPDGSIQQQGHMQIDGHEGSFRFNPKVPGVHTIWSHCTMGTDAWRYKHLIDVRESL